MFGQNNAYEEMVEATIKRLKCSITNTNYMYYGLSSPEGLEKIRIGKAVLHYAVTLRDLKNYKNEGNPKDIIRDMGFVTVPVINSSTNNIETFVLLNKRKGTFKSTGIGEVNYVEKFLEYKKEHSDKNLKLVRIPAMNIAFSGLEIDGVLHLISLGEKEDKNTVPRPAHEVFLELSKQIQHFKEDVPN